MEPDIRPLHSSPLPLNENGDGVAGLEEEGFGDFRGFSHGLSCSPPGFADSSSRLRQPSPTIKPATHQLNCNFNHPIKQSQPTSTVIAGSESSQIIIEGKDHNKPCVHLTNGYSEGHHNSGTHSISAEGVSAHREETGFADFTVFTEQPEHPWCCGFTPLGSTEKWDGRDAGPSSSCDPEHEVIMESEPRHHCTYKAKDRVCTMVNHCEKRDAAPLQPAQDDRQPQETAADLDFPPEEPTFEEKPGKPRHSRSCRISLDKEVQEDEEKSACTVNQTLNVYESASEDLASLCEDLSLEGPSTDLEPNVSSFASEDQTDWDQTDDEEEEAGNYSNCDHFVNKSQANLRQSKAENGFHYRHQSATQETSSTSNQSQPGTHTGDNFADFKDRSLEPRGDRGDVQTADAGSRQTLPPSDSFADFCSAPMQEDGEGLWAEFKDQKAPEGGRTWTPSGGQVSSLQTDGGTEEEEDWPEQSGASRRSSCQVSLSCRAQQLLLASFPEVEVPASEGEEEVLSLCALEEMQELSSTTQGIQRAVWRPHQDLHAAVGLQFQWGGSHTNITLLRCLGVDTKNIGTLEPTKNSVPAVCSPGHTVVTARALPAPTPLTDSMQEVLPSSQPDWSSRGLSSSQDGMRVQAPPSFLTHTKPPPVSPLVSAGVSALNLDYFGPEEESPSCSSSSQSSSPLPGVDRELYESTISQVETGTKDRHIDDALIRLMSTAEKTSSSVSKPQQDEELSAEAGSVISGLPNLSFMQAKFLMFPSILIPKECCSPKLQ